MAGSSPLLNINGCPVSIVLDGDGEHAVIERATLTEGPSADVVFKCDYANRNLVVLGLLGGVVNNAGTITRVPPMAYPPNPNIFCTNIGDITGIKPFTNELGWIEYQYVKIPAHFSMPTWDVIKGVTNPDPSGYTYTTTKFKGNCEIFVPPIGSYYYKTGTFSGKPVETSSVGIVRSHAEIQVTRHQIPFLPVTQLMDNAGSVNYDPIKFGDYTFPAGCVLYSTWDIEPKADPAGIRLWDINLSILANFDTPWNKFFDPAGSWSEINTKADGTGDPPFPAIDLRVILFGTALTL
jgi:hypothetical protein